MYYHRDVCLGLFSHAMAGWGRLNRFFCSRSVILVLEPSASSFASLSLDFSLKHLVLFSSFLLCWIPVQTAFTLPVAAAALSPSALSIQTPFLNLLCLCQCHMWLVCSVCWRSTYMCACATSGLPVVKYAICFQCTFLAQSCTNAFYINWTETISWFTEN